jgi:hypothetical protein
VGLPIARSSFKGCRDGCHLCSCPYSGISCWPSLSPGPFLWLCCVPDDATVTFDRALLAYRPDLARDSALYCLIVTYCSRRGRKRSSAHQRGAAFVFNLAKIWMASVKQFTDAQPVAMLAYFPRNDEAIEARPCGPDWQAETMLEDEKEIQNPIPRATSRRYARNASTGPR